MKYAFFNNCVGWPSRHVHGNGGLIQMVDFARPITRATFLRHVDRESLNDTAHSLGIEDWSETANDGYIGYCFSRVNGIPCYYFDHSRIEHVFTPNGIDPYSPLTAEQIAELTDDYDGLANIAAINAIYRGRDDSRLYPILGAFNATERAIRRTREYAKHCGGLFGLEYCYALEGELSRIVNGEV